MHERITLVEVSIYCRLSEDKHGTELGVQRQEDECRALADERGWTVREVIVDNDISATSGKRRPGFERLIESAPKAIVCWHIDRLVRLSKDLERVIELGVNVYAVQAGHLDLSTPAGRAVAKTVTAWAQYEGEQKAERQKASHRQRVQSGKPWWPTRPFGFEMDGTHREDEAQALRETYAEILNGAALQKVTRDLKAKGFVTPKGNQWRAQGLKPILLNARNAGIYVYNGEEVGAASWKPIVSEDVFRAVVRVLTSPERRKNWGKGGYNKRENLLTGIAQCAKCESTVRAAWRRDPKTGERTYKVYQCSGCHGVTLPAEWCDSLVARKVIDRVEIWKDSLPSASPEEAVDVAALRTEELALQTRKEEFVEDRALGFISREDMRAGIAQADARLSEIADILANHATERLGFNINDIEALWEWTDDGEGNVDVERFTPVVKRVCESITLTGPGKGGGWGNAKNGLEYGKHLVIGFRDPN